MPDWIIGTLLGLAIVLPACFALRCIQSHADRRRVAFEYVGLVYVRPAERGICLLDPPVGSPDMGVQLGFDAGYYRAELRFVPVPNPDETPTR